MDSVLSQVVASDSASDEGSRRSTTVRVNISIVDVNDNPPRFVQRDYSVKIIDNIPYYPEPSPIVQVRSRRVTRVVFFITGIYIYICLLI